MWKCKIVTLSGHVGRYSEKWAAERAAQKITGVKAFAIEVDVNLPETSNRTDADIARTAENISIKLHLAQCAI